MDEAQIEEEVRRLASLLQGCGEFGDGYRKDQGRYPKEGSLADQQQDASFGYHCKQVFNLAVAAHVATEDYLSGIGHLFGPPPVTVFTQQVALRSAVEASARSSYLMDETIDARERACRYLNERIGNLKGSLKMQRATGGAVSELKARLDGVWKDAQNLGFAILTDRKGKNVAVDARRPTATALIGKLFAKLDVDLGGLIYGYLSSVAHASLVGLLPSFELPEEVDEQGNRVGAGRVTTRDIAMQFSIAALAWATSFDRTINVAGWDLDP